MAMRLRDARPDDLDLLRHWDEQPHVRAAGGDPDCNDWDWQGQLGRRVPWRAMLIAEEDGRAVGFLQIIDPAEEESGYWHPCPANLRALDIWIGEATDLGRGLGRRMMALALERCFADPAVAAVLVDPLADNKRAHRFYAAAGFTLVGPRRFGPDDCLVYRIERAAWRAGGH